MDDFYKFSKAGGSSCFALFFTYPIDIYKIRQQTPISIKNNNILSFYKGFTFALPLTFIEKGLKIYSYDYFKTLFGTNFSYNAAILSGGIQSLLTNPIDIVKLRNQINNNKLPIYRGLHFTFCRDIPFNIIFFGISDNYDNKYSKFLGSFLATIIVTPIDVVKTRYSQNTNIKVLDVIKKMKLKDYFRGIIPRVLSIGTFYGISYNLYLYI